MKHLHTFESFLNESSQQAYSDLSNVIRRGNNKPLDMCIALTNHLMQTLEEVSMNRKESDDIYKSLQEMLKKFNEANKANESVNEGSASGWSKAQLDKELKELAQGAREAGDIDDSMAFDIADSWLMDNPGVESVIKKYYGATDAQGFVANRIA